MNGLRTRAAALRAFHSAEAQAGAPSRLSM